MNPNHPANNVERKGDYLEGKNIWLGVTGSVSCVETIGIARELLRYGANVTIVTNKAALELVGEKALEFACGKPIIKEITGQVEHVIAGHEADLLIIAPCCATSLGKMVNGIGDNPPMLVALTCIGAKTPMIVAPAMDKNMANSDIVKKNMKSVTKFAKIVEPIMVENKAKLPSKERLVAEVCKMAGPKSLSQRKILVIGGGSSEPIDDVRVISNKSSGFMAKSLTETAFSMGAEVDLWLGNATYSIGEWINTSRFETLTDLKKKVAKIEKYDVIIVPAALSDFVPEYTKGKIDSTKAITLKMKKAPKILGSIRKKHKGPLYSFKLGSNIKDNELLKKANVLLKNSDCVIANYSDAMGSESSKAAIVDKKNTKWITGTKNNLSRKVLEKIATELT
ncbi:bifunctional phosphopantothenoylcysteine decarboxylase/phosphopantothenate--cysteine ligase CoaBC [Euryarchaeota archaeon]|nr:bifunctional phosphopantothenoylcysteine decarboxylase/phosphopantothenate--cysteine ligase CoaBC [Euryarchaeota archaeon]